ncbi:MAG: zinc ABC transporter substrate-binding protein [Planctomycetota bacterium]
MNPKLLVATFVAVILAVGCRPNANSKSKTENPSSDPLQIVTTTGQINDAVKRLTEGADTSITLFCGPGVDPHSFSASTKDVQAMLDADLIVYNGFHLEARLSEHLHGAFETKAWAMSSSFPETARLDWIEDGSIDSDAPFDPHIWNHLPAWSECVRSLAIRLGKADSKNATLYRDNAEQYIQEILAVHQWADEKLKSLPSDRRIIVSAHDAFNYFAKVYDMETLAVLGIGNDPEADIKTMRKVADEIAKKKIPAIFMESITNPKVTQALHEACAARSWELELVARPLYSDDLGEAPPQDTFLGAFKSNVEIIFESLNK